MLHKLISDDKATNLTPTLSETLLYGLEVKFKRLNRDTNWSFDELHQYIINRDVNLHKSQEKVLQIYTHKHELFCFIKHF